MKQEEMGDPVNINFDLSELADTVVNRLVGTSSFKIMPFSAASNGVDIEKWIQDYENIASALKWDDPSKVKKLPVYLMGPADDWFQVNIKKEIESKLWDEVREEFIEYFTPASKSIYAREKIRQKKQLNTESVSDYFAAMQNLCLRANKDMDKDEVIQNIIEGLRPEIQKQMKMFDCPNVDTLLTRCKAIEDSLKCDEASNNEKTKEVMSLIDSISRLKTDNSDIVSAINDLKQTLTSSVQNSIKSCLVTNFHNNLNPAAVRFDTRNTQGAPYCTQCHKKGHTDDSCWFNYKNHSSEQTPSSQDWFDQNSCNDFHQPFQPIDERHFYDQPYNDEHQSSLLVNNVFNQPHRESNFHTDQSTFSFHYAHQPPLQLNCIFPTDAHFVFINAFIENRQYKALVDSGSAITLITADIARKISAPILQYSGPEIKMGNGTSLEPAGEMIILIETFIEKQRIQILVKAIVCHKLPFNILLGNDFNSRAGLLIDVGERRIILNSNTRRNETTPNSMHHKINVKNNNYLLTKPLEQEKLEIETEEMSSKANKMDVSTRQNDDSRGNQEFAIGDEVMKYDPVRLMEMPDEVFFKSDGPFVITEKLSPFVYRIQINSKTTRLANIARLTPYINQEQEQPVLICSENELMKTDEEPGNGTAKQIVTIQQIPEPEDREEETPPTLPHTSYNFNQNANNEESFDANKCENRVEVQTLPETKPTLRTFNPETPEACDDQKTVAPIKLRMCPNKRAKIVTRNETKSPRRKSKRTTKGVKPNRFVFLMFLFFCLAVIDAGFQSLPLLFGRASRQKHQGVTQINLLTSMIMENYLHHNMNLHNGSKMNDSEHLDIHNKTIFSRKQAERKRRKRRCRNNSNQLLNSQMKKLKSNHSGNIILVATKTKQKQILNYHHLQCERQNIFFRLFISIEKC